jgi:dimeric dUTPase (all-alpha-NTP-PPase superfamily)
MEIIVVYICIGLMLLWVIVAEFEKHLAQKKYDELVDLYMEAATRLIKENKEIEKSADEYEKLSCELKKAINLLEKGESNQDEHRT